MTAGPLLTIPQVAERFRVSERTVKLWIGSGELPAINASRTASSGKQRIRIRPDDVELFEAARSTTQTQQPAPRRRPRTYRQVL